MESDPFLQTTEPELIVDASLVALTVMSYLLPERKDLTEVFTDTIERNVNEILERKPILPGFTKMQIVKAVIMRSRLSLLIGYYGDLLFVKNFEAFKKSTSFLFESVGVMEGPEKVVGLQCIDTLKTITVDSDVAKRFLTFLPEIVQMIANLMTTVNYPQFFEFVLEFGKFFARVLNEQILVIFEATVARVLNEQGQREKVSDSGIMRIGKCMNILRMIVEKQEYISAYADLFEQKLSPIYFFMANP